MEEGFDGLLRDKTRPSRIPPAGCRCRRARRGAHPDRSAWRDDALDRRHDGEGVGISVSAVQRIWRAHGLRPHRVEAVQALHRSEVRRQTARCRRPLCRSARSRHRSVGRREEPNPGPRPHPARPSHEEGPRRNDDPRLQAQRHDHPLCRARRARRQGDRPLHATAPASGIHSLPQYARSQGP